VTIRWQAQHAVTKGDVNFSVTLFADGSFRFDYGPGNQELDPDSGPTVGVSAGNGFTYVVSGYNAQGDLENAASVLWTPTPGLTYYDIGAYEFQGDSSDTTPPAVESVRHELGDMPDSFPPPDTLTTDYAFRTFLVDFSEALDGISAASVANYELRSAGSDGKFDTSHDVMFELRPYYSFPETNLVLEIVSGSLQDDGLYRLTISGILDTAGNPLDGTGDGVGGDSYHHFFEIDRGSNVPPEADDLQVAVEEDDSVTIVLSGSDEDGDELHYGILTQPAYGTLSDFGPGIEPGTHEVTYTPLPDYNGPDSFTFQVDDLKLGVDEGTVSIFVEAVNDPPVAFDQEVIMATGTYRTIVLQGWDLETPASGLTFSIVDAPYFGELSQVNYNAWEYIPGQDYTGRDFFTFAVTDRGDPDGTLTNALTSDPAMVTVDIGEIEDNQAPFIYLDDGDSDSAMLVETDEGLIAAGTLTVTDFDPLDVVNMGFGLSSVTQRDAENRVMPADSLLPDDAGFLDMLGVTETPVDDGSLTGRLTWEFDSGMEAFDYLTSGETLTIVYTLTATDSQGAVDTHDVAVTITGTNDPPEISVGGNDGYSADVSVTGDGLVAEGTLTVTDVDTSDVVTMSREVNSVIQRDAGNEEMIPDVLQPGETALLEMLGVTETPVAAGDVSGGLTWKFDSGMEAFDYLAVGETLTIVYTLTATDSGGATDSHDVIIRIMGTNTAPVIEAVPDQVVDEGGLLSFTVAASDPDGDGLIFSLDDPPEGARIHAETGLFTWTPPDGPLVMDVTVRVTDDAASPLSSTTTFAITVENVPPILTIEGAENAYVGVPYELFLSSYDPGDYTIAHWNINWGDGSQEQVPGDPDSVSHTYEAPLPLPMDFDGDGDVDGVDALHFIRRFRSGNVDQKDLEGFASQFGRIGWDAYEVTATATDEDGTYSANVVSVGVLPVADEGDKGPQGDSAPLTTSEAVFESTHRPLAFSDPAPEVSPGAEKEPFESRQVSNPVVYRFDQGPVFGETQGQWRMGTDSLGDMVRQTWVDRRNEGEPFTYKPWDSTSSGRLVDLYGDYDDKDLIGEKPAMKAGGIIYPLV